MTRKDNHLFVSVLFALFVTLPVSTVLANDKAPRKYQCRSFADHPLGHLQSLWQGTDGIFYREASDFNSDYTFTKDQLQQYKKISDALKERNVELMLAITPTRGMVLDQGYASLLGKELDYNPSNAKKNFSAAIKRLNDYGVSAPNILDVYNTYQGKEYLFYATDHHWSPFGAREAAKAVGMQIREAQNYENLPKSEFETIEDGYFNAKLNMKDEIAKYCGLENFQEPYMRYVTSKSSSNADDLFGDAPLPEITLVGTSYSGVEDFNFAGFIQQETGLEVDNRAMNGGSLNHAMRQYLTSDEFQAHQPAFLVWEIPGYFNYYFRFGMRLSRQAVPAIHGPCAASAIVTSGDQNGLKLTAKMPQSQEISGDDYYIAVHSDEDIEKISLLLTYRDGEEESITLEDGFRGVFSHNFYWELAEDIKAPLESVSIERVDETSIAPLSMQLCQKE
ncbi:MAG: alginate O-acetyltransferase AlgX-related protein [bacterium]